MRNAEKLVHKAIAANHRRAIAKVLAVHAQGEADARWAALIKAEKECTAAITAVRDNMPNHPLHANDSDFRGLLIQQINQVVVEANGTVTMEPKDAIVRNTQEPTSE